MAQGKILLSVAVVIRQGNGKARRKIQGTAISAERQQLLLQLGEHLLLPPDLKSIAALCIFRVDSTAWNRLILGEGAAFGEHQPQFHAVWQLNRRNGDILRRTAHRRSLTGSIRREDSQQVDGFIGFFPVRSGEKEVQIQLHIGGIIGNPVGFPSAPAAFFLLQKMQAAGEASLVLSTTCQMQVDGHPVWKGFGQGKGDLFPITGDALLHCRRITSGGFLQGELVRPVGEKSHRHGAAADQRQQYHPEGGLPVMKHGLHPLPDSHLSESQRTGGNHSGMNTGHQESLGIVSPLHALHPADDLLVTCQFQIPTEQ